MSEKTILEHCAPTLAGIKTGNLVSCAYQSREEVRREVRRMNQILRRKGLRMIPLKYHKSRVLIYVYRPDMLSCDMTNPQLCSILRENGYSCCSQSACICHLICRLKSNEEFPHEIGLFLGYPPEDVRGFIDNKGMNSKLSGVWKVYGDVQTSQKRFEQFHRCTQAYCEAGKRGRTLQDLAVVRRGSEPAYLTA